MYADIKKRLSKGSKCEGHEDTSVVYEVSWKVADRGYWKMEITEQTSKP